MEPELVKEVLSDETNMSTYNDMNKNLTLFSTT